MAWRLLMWNLLFALLMLFGMGQAHAEETVDPTVLVAAPGYRVGPGDVLSVQVYNEKDLSGAYAVGQSGDVDLPLVGIFRVDGQDVEEIAASLTTKLASDFLVDPQVTVRVETFASRKVNVVGAVRKPGVIPLTGPTTLLDILSEAGGVVAERSSQEVQVKRARTGEIEPLVVNLERLLSAGEGNVTLEAGDVVYVPEGAFVFVSGQVGKPGQVPWRDGLTVTQAMVAAGGPVRTANLRKAYILREGGRIEINLRRVMKGKDADVPIQQGDQLFVDESVF